VADRTNRVRLLVASVVVWSAVMLASSAAQSFESLLLSRLALGAGSPPPDRSWASLIGDLFAAAEGAGSMDSS